VSNLHALSGAFVLGALDADEQAEFETHLRSCSSCRVEVRELRETTALLGIAAAQPASPALRAAVLDEIGRTRQLPPLVVSLQDRARTRRLGLRRWGLSAAACLAVLALGLGVYAGQLRQENSDLRHREQQIAALETAADARTVTTSAAGATATVTLSRSAEQMEFRSSGLFMHPGRTYQLWLIGPNGPRSAGVFHTDNGQHAPRLFPGPGDATVLAVTEEPAGGSAQPTTSPILRLPLPGV
jgi:anti-sigma-K factor RskA